MSSSSPMRLEWVTEHLAVGHAPLTQGQLAFLKEQGITAILKELYRMEQDFGFEVHYLPVMDEETPDLQELEKALSWLDEAVYLGKKIYIHCHYGIGRTGTVLNAYFLRKGFGHRLAAKKLKRFRSKPSNFTQWRTIRKYGRNAGRLSVREPSLEFKKIVDLGPFFQEYKAVAAEVEEKARFSGSLERCGREHAMCCRTPVLLTLVEAVYISHAMNTHLASTDRVELIGKAVRTATKERSQAESLDSNNPFCLTHTGALCPLSENGVCRLFEDRPFQCRTSDLHEPVKAALWNEMLHPFLEKVSQELFIVFSDRPAPEELLFALPDVVSGKYVQNFFHLLRRQNGG
ncbi:MAG: protein-tyrosine phosphatase family protein [Desulfovibrionales bacterium]